MSRDEEQNVDWELPTDLIALEAKLASLRPRGDRLDRERLAFLAGQASVSRGNRWPTAFAAMTVVAATLLGLLITNLATTKDHPNDVQIAIQDGKPAPPSRIVASHIADNRGTVLSTSDAYNPDIMHLLVQGESLSVAADHAPERHGVEDRERFILTPSTWHRLLDEPKIAKPSPNDSSTVSPHQGANS